ncbi:unnamed protein product [Closterium sp. Naga37s-1]|nr:unnamed protein product [Closterium sp. Naga37s-1]
MTLQEVFTAPNLELQGIHQVRWLSRGDAILRAVEVFPALIVMLYEWDSTLYELATSYRFHFLLYFLADVLEQLNVLNRAFQQRELDIAGVHAQIKRSLSFLESRYVDCGDDFGGGMSARLSLFIKKHGPEGGRPEVKVQGVDLDGRPTTHTFQLHENSSKDYPTLGTHDAYVDLCTTFAKTLIWCSYKKRRPFGNVAAAPAREGEGSGNGKGTEADEEAEEELEEPEANCSDDDD